MKNKKNHILQIAFYIIFILILFSISGCSSPTETPTGELSGFVNLEGMQDHSGIVIALYDLAYLDTTIVRINNQYPQIGVHITQHTEFDHRLQSPIKTTETLADGSFELIKIPTGIYNLVAMKAGFGFKYLYEIEIAEGDNELSELTFSVILSGVEGSSFNSQLTTQHSQLANRSSDLTLFHELHISGNIQEDIIVLPDHHLIIDDDTVFIPGSSLTIHPGAVIRINLGIDLTIHGTFTAHGEENNMFWVTSNDGFDSSLLLTTYFPREELLLYNSMELSSIATVENDLIEWGKWDWGTFSLTSSISSADFSNCIFRNSESGLSIETGNVINMENILAYNCSNSSYGGIVCFNTETLTIENGIYLYSHNGLYMKFCNNTNVNDNYISNNQRGILGLTIFGDITHNELNKNEECDIKLAGNTTQGEIRIKYNNLNSNTGIWQYKQGSFNWFYSLFINNNNFFCAEWFIKYDSSSYVLGYNIDATNNFFNFFNNEILINGMILDHVDEYLVLVIIDAWLESPINNAGIIF